MVIRPALELHFSHKLGLDPSRRGVQFRLLSERIGLALQRLEQRLRPLERLVVATPADVRGLAQLVSLPITEEHRSARRAPAPPLRGPPDPEGLAVPGPRP